MRKTTKKRPCPISTQPPLVVLNLDRTTLFHNLHSLAAHLHEVDTAG